MTLTVHTARVSYGGPDRLDITRKSAGPDGIAFAPSWKILQPMLRARGDWAERNVPREQRAATEARLWSEYLEAYTAEMRESYRANRVPWDTLLARESVTLVCYCSDHTRCHRTVLAGMLAKLGATGAGERL